MGAKQRLGFFFGSKIAWAPRGGLAALALAATALVMPTTAGAAFPGQGFLPDNRAWEMVSPVDKNGGEIAGDSTRTRAALDGSAVSFASLSAFGDVIGTGAHVEYVSVRGPGGWATHAVTPPQEPITAGPLFAWRSFYQGEFSSDLSRGIFRSFSPVTSDPNVELVRNLYLRDDLRTPGPGSYQLLTSSVIPQPLPSLNTGVPAFADATDDFDRIIFESPLNLTPDAPSRSQQCIDTGIDCRPRLYEWHQGAVHLMGILPDSACGIPPCVAPSSSAGAGASGPGFSNTQRAFSDDGTRLFFASPVSDAGDPYADTQLYMRVGGSTVRVNASEKAAPDPVPSRAMFEAATPDGGKVFFTSPEQLTEAPEGGLYVYDAAKPDSQPDNLTLIAPGGVNGVVGVSDDGAYVYFVATGQLVPEAPPDSIAKLYVWHGGTTRYIGAFEDANDVERNTAGTNYSINVQPSRVTPDGTRMIFTSHSGAGFGGFAHSNDCDGSCSEVYVYDATANGGAGELSCASCNPSGAGADTDATPVTRTGVSLIVPSSHLNHALSDDGRWVFFTSGERLAPQDTNGKVPDVYQYDTATGQIRLISSGKSGSGSYFMEATPDGSDVFFVTKERLSAWDVDPGYDLYDARVGAGLPEPPPPAVPCSGADCRAGAGVSSGPSAATAALVGAGNATPRRSRARRCPRGKRRVRRSGRARCVTPRKSKSRANHDRRASR